MRNGFLTLLIVVAVVGGFLLVVYSNSGQAEPLRPVIPTQPSPTVPAESWQDILRAGLNVDGTPVPTIAIPQSAYVPPTLPAGDAATATLVQAAALMQGRGVADVFVAVSTPTPPPPTLPTVIGQQAIATRVVATDRPVPTNPPPLPVPLVRHPFDHYYFIRPVDSNRMNRALPYYRYGTNGPRDNPLRIHHGIDMSNTVGTPIRAAGDGTVIFVTSPETPTFQDSPSYGVVVVIEHDFSFQGKPLHTLYAHIEAPLVTVGQRVRAGEAIALIGNTGLSSGPHVHFEVRMGENIYGSTYNPVLWMAPYVGHGTVAGQVVDSRGIFIDDIEVTLSRAGYTQDTATTYVFRDVGSRVNSDPNWNENFAIPDVPEGRYTVEATINGQRIREVIDVREGMTTFVRLQTQQPVELPQSTATPESEDS